MKDKNGFFLLYFSSVLCVILIICSVFFIGKNEEIFIKEQSIKEYNLPTTSHEENSNSDKSVTASAQGEIIGQIKEKYISPYSANTKYNGVYLKNRTDIPVDLKEVLSKKTSVRITKNSAPQVLIVHTHTTECYMAESKDYYTDKDPSRTLDESKNIVAVGEYFKRKLDSAGIVTVHAKEVHDNPSYTGSYVRSKETIKKYLAQYPSIKVVIDIHRDSVALSGKDKAKPLIEIDGKKTAQVMLVMGCGEGISGHDKWKENLSFAVKYQQTMEAMYPGFARPISFVVSRYNQELTVGSILLEVGCDTNTLEEAFLAADKASTALIAYLNTLTG